MIDINRECGYCGGFIELLNGLKFLIGILIWCEIRWSSSKLGFEILRLDTILELSKNTTKVK